MSASDPPKQRKTLGIKPQAKADTQGPEKRRPPVRGRHLSGHAKPRTQAAQAERRPPPAARRDDEGPSRPQARATPSAAGRDRPPRPDVAARAQPRRRPHPSPEQAATHAFFVPCPKGLEAELVQELAELGINDARPAPGGAAFKGSLLEAWRVNLWSRLAVRVLWRVGEGPYRQEADLYDGALKVDWPALFAVSRTIAVHTVARHSPLKSLNFAGLKVKDAVCDRFRAELGERPSVDPHHPQVPLVLYLTEARYSLYLDLSGEPLNRRGFRVQPAAAPLNENLAAGMLRLAGWRPGTPFFDPMMGGGTLLMEAAMMWLNRAPGLKRHFAFEHLQSFDRIAWQRLRKDAEAAAHAPQPLPIFGADIDPAMVRAARLNLKAAGLLDCVQLLQADFLEVDPPPVGPGILVCNPPYGVRLSLEGTHATPAAFYKAMGDVLKRKYPGWTAHFLSADADLPKHIGLAASRRTPLYNGPLECRFYAYPLVSGAHRR